MYSYIYITILSIHIYRQRVNFPGGCIRFMLVVIYCTLSVLWRLLRQFQLSYLKNLLSFCQVHKKFRGIVVVIVIFCNFYNIRFSCCVKDLYPGTPDFFFSSANAHALSSRRSRWRDDARKERLLMERIFQTWILSKSLRIYAIYKPMLCITGINQVPILFRRYIHYTELGSS
jgi:hypothetical protein